MPDVYLGIDFGTKRVGLAIGQSITATARPLEVIPNNGELINTLKKRIEEWQITAVVIGLPLTMDGSDQALTKQVRNWANKVQHHCQRPVHLMDERLTSFEAEREFQQQRQQQQAKAKHKKQVDAMAAQIILQSWLNQQ